MLLLEEKLKFLNAIIQYTLLLICFKLVLYIKILITQCSLEDLLTHSPLTICECVYIFW